MTVEKNIRKKTVDFSKSHNEERWLRESDTGHVEGKTDRRSGRGTYLTHLWKCMTENGVGRDGETIECGREPCAPTAWRDTAHRRTISQAT